MDKGDYAMPSPPDDPIERYCGEARTVYAVSRYESEFYSVWLQSTGLYATRDAPANFFLSYRVELSQQDP